MSEANQRQVAGDHYKSHKYETWDVICDWRLGYLDGNAVKYLSRWRTKHASPQARLDDLLKAQHYIEKQIEEVRREWSDVIVVNPVAKESSGEAYARVREEHLRYLRSLVAKPKSYYKHLELQT